MTGHGVGPPVWTPGVWDPPSLPVGSRVTCTTEEALRVSFINSEKALSQPLPAPLGRLFHNHPDLLMASAVFPISTQNIFMNSLSHLLLCQHWPIV